MALQLFQLGTRPPARQFENMSQDDDRYSGLYERAAKLRAALAEAVAKARQDSARAEAAETGRL
jgi:hypothetical protein